jgi:hypothetical protein
MEARMTSKTPAELRADEIVNSDIVAFQKNLNSESEEVRYKIVEALLADDPETFQKYPLS